MPLRIPFLSIALVGALALVSGCATRLCLYDVRVTIDPTLNDMRGRCESVEVHLVALDSFQSENMARRSMTDYWRPGRRPDPYEAMKTRLYFGEGKDHVQIFDHENSLWPAWDQNDTRQLWLLADLPGVHQDTADDPRRLVVPLRRTCSWFRKAHPIDIGIGREGLYYIQPGAPAAEGSREATQGEQP